MEHLWKDTDIGKLKYLVGTLLATFAPQTMHGMACVCTCAPTLTGTMQILCLSYVYWTVRHLDS